jgi:hypothetical protein
MGMSCAMARFSYLLVPVGQVPSGGKALTGQVVAVALEQEPRHVARSRERPGTGRRSQRAVAAPRRDCTA